MIMEEASALQGEGGTALINPIPYSRIPVVDEIRVWCKSLKKKVKAI
jgi:hypothetical protein